MELEHVIEDLISKNASDFEISKVIKNDIKEYRANLKNIFLQNGGKDFLVKNSKKIDSYINLMYKYVLREMFHGYIPLTNSIPISFVALGSYGREQLCVYSDIDLMIVYKDVAGFNTKAIIEKFLYLVWDSGLKLGHRVHEIGELKSVANEDITIKTALIESRFITGSKYLWVEIENSLKKIRNFEQKEFIIKKIDELNNRHKKYKFTMEPNIKEGIGSLRDSNTLFWIANIIYNVSSTKQLIGKIFTEDEYKEYRIAIEFLFSVRSTLHLIAQKKEDTLRLELIPEVSKFLNIFHQNPQIAQQQLSSKLFFSLIVIKNFSHINIDKIVRKNKIFKKEFGFLRASRVFKDIYLIDNKLFATYNCKQKSQTEILDIIISMPNVSFDVSFVNLVKNSDFSNVKNEKEKILKLFTKPNIYEILMLFYDSFKLEFIFPALKKILYLAQFDGYHEHPVDIHSFNTIKNIDNIQNDFLKSLFMSFSEDEKMVLRIIALLHDSGKGRKNDHRDVGVSLYKLFCKQFNISDYFTELGSIVIKHHTLMSDTAHKEDIYSQKIVSDFVANLKSKEALNFLFILTYADLNAVNIGVYSTFTERLLFELYHFSLDRLNNSEQLQDAIRKNRKINSLKKESEFLTISKPKQKKILSIESSLF
ncbi:MAG: HD domain-containing protein, partial [Campylobacterales bacterium]|nr:HD domain-containing protein [Campylobacterales bacterium]